MHSCEYASVITYAGVLGMTVLYGGARRPEKRVHARSNPPHQKWQGLHFPAKPLRKRFIARSASSVAANQRRTAPPSYDAWRVSSAKRVASGISFGDPAIRTVTPSSRNIARYSL